MDSMIGQIVDNYKIIEVLGRGGMGVVFKAMDINLEKIVALKMIDPFLAKDENFLRRFKTEAKALAKLENPNIVSVYALRETELGLFMVMEYVEAKTISERLKENGKFAIKDTVAILKQILNAIGHAHKVGVIHRDIKPNNILLCEDGTVKVMDFGLAKVVQDHGSQNTVTQAAAGTLYYMSPEQIKGLKNVDNRSDIYSIGMSVYEMLAGRCPFDKSESEYAIQKQIVDGKIPSPLKYNPLIPKQLLKLLLKSIDKDADKRFQNIVEMISALNQVNIEDEAEDDKTRVITSFEQSEIKQASKKKTANKFYLIGAGAVFVLLLLYFFVFNTKEKVEIPKKTVVVDTLSNLSITSNPAGAAVFINDKNYGITPLSLDSFAENKYRVKISKKGFQEWINNNYDMEKGNNNIDVILDPIEKKVEYATFVLNAKPKGSIYIDNKLVSSNTNEVINKQVTAGKHAIKFVNTEYGSAQINLDIKQNQTKNLTCYFQQQVNIQSLNSNGDAFWGSIYINGTNTEKTTPSDILLSPGNYKIAVKKMGYKTVENEVDLKITPTFSSKSHSLVFHFKKP